MKHGDLIRRLQFDRCVICGKDVEPAQRSWDHFIPAAFQGGSKLHIGLSFLAHQRCNSQRGHKAPTRRMIKRAASVIAAMPDEVRAEALQNLEIARERHSVLALVAHTTAERVRNGNGIDPPNGLS